MIPTGDEFILLDRATWFNNVLDGLYAPVQDRLRTEFESHYDQAFQRALDSGETELAAHFAAMQILGNKGKVRKSLRAKYLTEAEFRGLTKDGAFSSPRYSRMLSIQWGTGAMLAIKFSILTAIWKDSMFTAAVMTLCALLMGFAIVTLYLSGQPPTRRVRSSVYVIIAILFAWVFWAFIFAARLHGLGFEFASVSAWCLLSLGVLSALMLALIVALYLRLLEKARNCGLEIPQIRWRKLT